MKQEFTTGTQPLALQGIQGVSPLLSFGSGFGRFSGCLQFRRNKSHPESDELSVLKEAALAGRFVDAVDPFTGNVRVFVTGWYERFNAARNEFETSVEIQGDTL
jgi:hypothetical protein